MTYEKWEGGTLDYFPCRYGESRLVFRGPRRDMEGDFVAFLGGTETYGKFLPEPFPHLVERELDMECVNFGWPNAGIDVFLNDSDITSAARRSKCTVLQVSGINNISNRMYTVHPRRNDRFLQASQMMQSIFSEVDFTEFHFTRHMLSTLFEIAPDRFDVVRSELQQAWLSRMQLLLKGIGPKVVLLWLSDHMAGDAEGSEFAATHDPYGVDRKMLAKIRPLVSEIVEVKASEEALERRNEGMIFDQVDAPIALEMLGAMAHNEASEALVPAITRAMEKRN